MTLAVIALLLSAGALARVVVPDVVRITKWVFYAATVRELALLTLASTVVLALAVTIGLVVVL